MTADSPIPTIPKPIGEMATEELRRRRTRQAAVKLLYAYSMQDGERTLVKTREDVIMFSAKDMGMSPDKALDVLFLDVLVGGVQERMTAIDDIIRTYLADTWKFSRIDVIMRDLLRLGVYELAMMPEITVATIINEYIEISRGYFTESEVAFVNALLDNAASALREGHVAEKMPEQPPVSEEPAEHQSNTKRDDEG